MQGPLTAEEAGYQLSTYPLPSYDAGYYGLHYSPSVSGRPSRIRKRLNSFRGKSDLNQPYTYTPPEEPPSWMTSAGESFSNWVNTNISAAGTSPSEVSSPSILSRLKRRIRSPPAPPPSDPSTKDKVKEALTTLLTSAITASINWMFDQSPTVINDYYTRCVDILTGTPITRQLEDGSEVCEGRKGDGLLWKIYNVIKSGGLQPSEALYSMTPSAAVDAGEAPLADSNPTQPSVT